MNFRLLLAEIISIIIGVVLGFTVANWNTGRSLKKDAKKNVERIYAEIISNKHQLEYHNKYYDQVRFELDSIKQIKSVRSIYDLPSWRGPSPPTIRVTAYRLAIALGTLKHIDLELANRLDNLYSVAESYKNFAEGVLQFSLLNENAENVDYQIRVINLFDEYAKVYLQEVNDVERYLEEKKIKLL